MGTCLGGLLGILLSPGRGLLIYTPIALFAIAAFLPRARETQQKHRLLVVAAGTFSLLHIAVIASWPVWWGGYCWGPRLLTEILAPLMILIAVGLPALRPKGVRWAFASLAAYSVLIQALGVFYYPKGRWDHLPVSVDAAPARLWNWADNPVIRTARAGIAWEPYSIIAALTTGAVRRSEATSAAGHQQLLATSARVPTMPSNNAGRTRITGPAFRSKRSIHSATTREHSPSSSLCRFPLLRLKDGGISDTRVKTAVYRPSCHATGPLDDRERQNP
jgi:hypothetical protein